MRLVLIDSKEILLGALPVVFVLVVKLSSVSLLVFFTLVFFPCFEICLRPLFCSFSFALLWGLCVCVGEGVALFFLAELTP